MLNTHERKQRIFALFVLGSALALGCAEAPVKSVEEVTSAFESVKKSEAADYAPEAFAAAESAYTDAMLEVEEQNKKIVFMRSYDRAKELLSKSKEVSESAKETAEERREEMKRYADGLIKNAQSAVAAARSAVEKRRPVKQDKLSDELETADEKLFDAEKAWKEGQYLVARDKAEDAKAKADDVLENVSPTKRG